MKCKVLRKSCTNDSKIFKQICNSKFNNKIMPNGDIRIGDDMAMNNKTHIIYKIK